MASEINREEFLGISFSHHMEILHKTKDIHEILFYIHQTVLHKWDKYDLRDCFERNLYAKNGAAANKKRALALSHLCGHDDCYRVHRLFRAIHLTVTFLQIFLPNLLGCYL